MAAGVRSRGGTVPTPTPTTIPGSFSTPTSAPTPTPTPARYEKINNALTRALMGLLIFHDLMGGLSPPPRNSAPRSRSEKPKSAFEASSKIITKVF